MKEQITSISIAVALIVASAVISQFYPEHVTIRDSVYMGLFTYLVSILFFFTKRLKIVDSIRNIEPKIDYIFKHISIEESLRKTSVDAFGVFWYLCLIRAREGTYELIDSNTFKVYKDQLPSFWQQAILNADINWNCTNFVNLPEDLCSSWAIAGFRFQSMVSKTTSVPVKRLFIVKDRSEVTDNLIEHMKWQQSLGFMVKIITRDKKMKWAPFEELESMIDTVDIAIINGRYLIAFLLTEEEYRGISFLRCYSDMNIVNKVNENFKRLWDSAIPVESIEIFLKGK